MRELKVTEWFDETGTCRGRVFHDDNRRKNSIALAAKLRLEGFDFARGYQRTRYLWPEEIPPTV